MLKRVEEDWSFFDQAVREKAAGKPKPRLKLVDPEAPPPPPPSQPSPKAANPPAPPVVSPLKDDPLAPIHPGRKVTSMGSKAKKVFRFCGKMLLLIVGIILLLALIGSISNH